MNNQLVAEEDLREWLGFEQRAAIEKWLKEHGITYSHGKGGRLLTTVQAINSAKAANNDFENFDFVSSNGSQPSH